MMQNTGIYPQHGTFMSTGGIKMSQVSEIPFEPVTVTIDGNDFTLANEYEAAEFIDMVTAYKNRGHGPGAQLTLMLGEDFELKEAKVYSEGIDAFNDYILL